MMDASRHVSNRRDHFLWQEIVAARTDISAAFKAVAWRLVLHRNVKAGRCDPSYAGLASGSGTSESTARRAIAKFISLGLIEMERSGGGRAIRNHYRLIIQKGCQSCEQVSATETVSETVSGGAERVSGHAGKGVRAVNTEQEENKKIEHSAVAAGADAPLCVTDEKKEKIRMWETIRAAYNEFASIWGGAAGWPKEEESGDV